MPLTLAITTAEASALGTIANLLDNSGMEMLLAKVRANARTAKLTRLRGGNPPFVPTGQALTDAANVQGDAAAAAYLGRTPTATYTAAVAYGSAVASAYAALVGLYGVPATADAALVQLDQLTGASHAA